jgi:proline iminopeptidase
MAIKYALKYPQHVSHLVLIAISPKESFSEGDMYFETLASPERKTLLIKNMSNPKNDFIGRMLTYGPMLWYQHDYDATVLWEGLNVNVDIVGYLWGKLFMQIDISDDAAKIQTPVFVALGKYDFFNPYYLWNECQNKFKDITIKVLEQAGHTPQLEKPEEFDSELLRWLSLK